MLAHLRQIAFWSQDNGPLASIFVRLQLEEGTRLLQDENRILLGKMAKLMEEHYILKTQSSCYDKVNKTSEPSKDKSRRREPFRRTHAMIVLVKTTDEDIEKYTEYTQQPEKIKRICDGAELEYNVQKCMRHLIRRQFKGSVGRA